MDLLNMLTSLMTSSSSVDALSTKTGTDSDQTKSILGTALPMLFSALTNNASSEDGASSLLGALQQHTNTASMAEQIKAADTEDGGKIISHILGDKKTSVVQEISEKTGAKEEQVSSLLSNIAPGLMSGISAVTTAAKKQTVKLKSAKAEAAKTATATAQAVKDVAAKVAASSVAAVKKESEKAEAAKEEAKEAVKETAKEASEASAKEESAGLDLSSLLGLLGGGEIKADDSGSDSGSGLLGNLLGGLGGLFGGGSDSDSGDGGLLGALKNILK